MTFYNELVYLNLLEKILVNGSVKSDRTGTGTRSLFGQTMRFDLRDSFPLLTTKKMYWKGIVHELLWFLSGSTNIDYLKQNKVNIWNEWADETGELGPVYGFQWRNFNNQNVDQISELITSLKTNPDSRRHIVTAWNPAQIHEMNLPPCHMMFQCYVDNGYLSLMMYQRSADMFLGMPFNIASYALLTHMIAHVCNLKADKLIITVGDAHIYSNHIEQCYEQIGREMYLGPTLQLNSNIKDIFCFTFDHIMLKNYKSRPKLKGEIAV